MQAAINGEEEERKRIAQDLHDSIGPYLSTAKLYINSGALSVKDSRGAEIKKELGDILNLAISSVREISGNLGSYVLRSAGLYTALQNFTEKISSNCKIRFDLQIPKDCPFTEKVETGLFRILVELINNSVKYSSATEIAIKHSEISNTVCIGYFENGVGFDVAEALNHRTGMGLYNIHSRVDSLGGLMEYYSSPGKGVSVKITFIRKHIYKQPVES
jgi:signal transduction histidine kinase